MVAAARQHAIVIPREHGAWGILLIPLATGVSLGLLTGGSPSRLAPLSIATFALFWLRTPIESWTGSSPVRARTPAEIRLARKAAIALATVSTLALIWLFWGGRNHDLLWIGTAAGVAFVVQAILKQGRNSRTAVQIAGAVGLTSTAPAAYYVVTAHMGIPAGWLWAANLLFAVNQIQFVQLQIRASRAVTRRDRIRIGRRFLVSQIILMSLAISAYAVHLLPWYAALAFLPLLIRGFAWFAVEPRPLVIHALGKRELGYAVLFGVCLVAGMLVP